MSGFAAEVYSGHHSENETYSPEEARIYDKAYELGRDEDVFKKRLDMVNRMGVIGERRMIAMVMIALDSRLIIPSHGNAGAIGVKAVGSSGTGKSHVLNRCLDIYDPEGYRLLTSASDKSLFYLDENELKHKCLILQEAFLLEQARGSDSAFQYSLRTFLSEGHLAYSVRGEERNISGPTSFITTTVCEKLEHQTDQRMFIVRTDESAEQTKKIMEMGAKMAAGDTNRSNMAEDIAVFRKYHALLQPVDVVIPFAPEITASVLQSPQLSSVFRRAQSQFFSVINAITVSHQFTNLRNDDHKCVADFSHYDMALQIMKDAFRERVGGESRETSDRLAYIFRNGPVKAKDLMTREGMSKQEISAWNKRQVEKGNLVWCDENGREFANTAICNRAKNGGKASLTVGPEYDGEITDALPNTFELSGDPRWAEGGELKKKYDLELDAR